jgi:hypothetical protein
MKKILPILLLTAVFDVLLNVALSYAQVDIYKPDYAGHQTKIQQYELDNDREAAAKERYELDYEVDKYKQDKLDRYNQEMVEQDDIIHGK